jgi:SAM-dependent methyltransferase
VNEPIDPYVRRIRTEWQLFADDPTRVIDWTWPADLQPRVLDVGCGAAQELRPFLVDSRGFGVGIDVSPQAGPEASRLFAQQRPQDHVAFVRAAAEQLPFSNSCFDVVVCRLALPYTNNTQALAEMARVLGPGGLLFLRFHHARYYLAKLRRGVTTGRAREVLYAARVLIAGCVYHLTGVQVRGPHLDGETFQTLWLLKRELGRHGLVVRRVLDSVPTTPHLLIAKIASTA